jgi:sialate O-acetylesterase
MKSNPITLVALLLASTVSVALAKPVPASLFTDHALLQQEKPVPVWGQADPGEIVSIEFAGQTRSATTDKDGKWLVRLDSMPASSEGREMVIKGMGENPIVLKDILLGEVWLCAGQSNMAFAVKEAVNGAAEVAQANDPQIRLFKVGYGETYAVPQTKCAGKWEVCSPTTVPWFSAVGYFFGRELQKSLHVPVGLLQSAVSGWPLVREAQMLTAATLPNCGLAVTIDIGDPKQIHPTNKQEVGRRLALNALAKDYNMAGLPASPFRTDNK